MCMHYTRKLFDRRSDMKESYTFCKILRDIFFQIALQLFQNFLYRQYISPYRDSPITINFVKLLTFTLFDLAYRPTNLTCSANCYATI